MTWAYKCVASKQNLKNKTSSMTTTTTLEEQITVLVCQLELTKEAKKREEARQEAECKEVENAREEKQCRLQAEAEAVAEHERCDTEEPHIEQEWREKEEEEEEARCCRSRQESTLTPVAAPESERGQELRRCDSCERQNVECICIKVSDFYLKIPITDSPIDRQIPLLPPMPGATELVLHWRWGSGPEETGM